jgi:hypothetical protein
MSPARDTTAHAPSSNRNPHCEPAAASAASAADPARLTNRYGRERALMRPS